MVLLKCCGSSKDSNYVLKVLLEWKNYIFLANLRQNARQKTISKKLFFLYTVYMVDFLLQIASLIHQAPHKTKSLKQIESCVLDIAQISGFWSFLCLQAWNISLCSIWYHGIFTRIYIKMKPKVWAFQSSTRNCSQVNSSFKKVC